MPVGKEKEYAKATPKGKLLNGKKGNLKKKAKSKYGGGY